MIQPTPRLVAIALTLAAAIAPFVLHATLGTPIVSAAPCCQDCQGREAAGNAECAATSHSSCPGGLQACYQKVQADVTPCWNACICAAMVIPTPRGGAAS